MNVIWKEIVGRLNFLEKKQVINNITNKQFVKILKHLLLTEGYLCNKANAKIRVDERGIYPALKIRIHLNPVTFLVVLYAGKKTHDLFIQTGKGRGYCPHGSDLSVSEIITILNRGI